MKIRFEDVNGNCIRNFNHSEEVLIRKPTKQVKVFGRDGTVLEVFEYIDHKEPRMIEISTTGNLEVYIVIVVGRMLYDKFVYRSEKNHLTPDEAEIGMESRTHSKLAIKETFLN